MIVTVIVSESVPPFPSETTTSKVNEPAVAGVQVKRPADVIVASGWT